MGKIEDKIMEILKGDNLQEAVDFEIVGGPDPSSTLKGPLDYTKPVTKATVPQAYAIPGVGEVGDDESGKNDPITDVVDNLDEEEDEKEEDDDEGEDEKLDETFAALLSRLAEEEDDDEDDDDEEEVKEEEGETSLKADNGGTPEETLPDVDSKLDSPDKLVTKAPGIEVAEEEEEGETSLKGDNGGTPEETLPDVDSKLDKPDSLVTPAVGAKSPNPNDTDVKEDIDAIFAGTKLTEAAKAKAATIYKAAVTRRVNEEKQRVQQVATKKLKEAFAILKARTEHKQQVFEENLTGQVDRYLNYVVENWMSENRLAVEKGIRAELAESFISGLKELFVEHYIEVPESKVDVVSTLGKKVTKLESKLNEQIEQNTKMRASLNSYRKEEVVRAVSSGLADTQREKLAKLAEGVEYTTRKEFATKLQSLKEAYFAKSPKTLKKEEKPLVEEVKEPSNDEMSVYTQTLSKMSKK